MKQTNPINIVLDVPLITQKCASRILRTIVEVSMFQRNQIPFVYEIFCGQITKWDSPTENTASDDDASVPKMRSMHLTKQRTKARETLTSTQVLFDTVDKIITEHSTVREVMILFGKTIYTAKEAIIVNLPSINTNHVGQNHRNGMSQNLREIAKTLSLSNEIFDNMQVKDTTNMFVLCKPLLIPQVSGNGIFPVDEFQLPSKCIQFVINLNTSELVPATAVFEIFDEDPEAPKVSKTGTEPTAPPLETANKWYQLDVVVKGFKLIRRKGCHIWE
ncbi:uncharacterized protein LOC131285936 [Anopheles ziemanni]|uniref:uncharacterized protein LOC131260844 n=1 Tax=Anopheles coustani TaxID=139045 RepID=UPI0026584B56|nr:uncharacterized protein LOC131260844 [Anopheles coustani]XP_058170773.1 uncharacterized protein LOC131285936 [Anopheles ziemanni]